MNSNIKNNFFYFASILKVFSFPPPCCPVLHGLFVSLKHSIYVSCEITQNPPLFPLWGQDGTVACVRVCVLQLFMGN